MIFESHQHTGSPQLIIENIALWTEFKVQTTKIYSKMDPKKMSLIVMKYIAKQQSSIKLLPKKTPTNMESSWGS